jgi:superfamily II DNA or RNA helicase
MNFPDFYNAYLLLDDRLKYLLELFCLACEDASVYDFNNNPQINKGLDTKKNLTIRVKDCNELFSIGLLNKNQFNTSFIFPLQFQAHFFPLVYKNNPVLAENINEYFKKHSHSYYYSNGVPVMLRKAMLFALGSKRVTIQEFISPYREGRIDDKLVELLFRNPVFHSLLKDCNRLLPAELFEKYIKFHIQNGMEIKKIKEWFIPLFDLMLLMGLDNGLEHVRNRMNDHILMLSALVPGDDSENINTIKMDSVFLPVLDELYHSSDMSNSKPVELFAKEILVLKNRKFDDLNPVFQLAFCLLLIANKELAAKYQTKVVKFFNAKGADTTFLNLIYIAYAEFQNAEHNLTSEFNKTRFDKGWVGMLSMLVTAYILNAKLPISIVESAKLHLQDLKKAGYLVPAYEMAYILMTETGNKDFADIYEELRNKLGFIPLMARFTKKKDYENKLEAIISIVQSSNSTTDTIPDNRIIYLVDGESGNLQPVLQARKGSGWTSGRDCSLTKFRKGDYPGMSEQDYLFASCIREYHSYYGNSASLEQDAAWKALVGHPLLFNSNNKNLPVELVLHKPALIFRQSGEKYLLEFDKFPRINGLPLEIESESRIIYIETDAVIQKIHEQMTGGILIVPENAKDLVLKAIESVSKVINVYSDIEAVAENNQIIEKPSESTLRILLAPFGSGLRAQVLAKPFGTDPPYVAPGKGSRVLYTQINGEKIKVARNLAAETEKMLKLDEAFFDEGLMMGDNEYLHFSDPLDALILLEVIQNNKDLCIAEWPEGVKFKISGVADFSNLSLKLKKSGNWFDVEGEVKVNDSLVIGMKQLLEMKPVEGHRFIEIADGEFISLSKGLKRRLDELRSQVIADKNGLHVSGLSLPYFFSMGDDFGTFSADKAAREIKKKFDAAQELSFGIPENLDAELRPYQADGFIWISRLAEWGAGACLADDMGLGKTVQSIAFLLSKANEGPSLVVCPASVLPNWIAEVRRFAPALNVVYLNSNKRNETLENLKNYDLLVTTYGLIQSEDELFASIEWNVVVLDEAHVIKNHTTKTWTAAMKLKSRKRLALTGTPVQNNLDELWSIFSFLNPGLLGSFKSFTERFSVPVANQTDSPQKTLLRKIIGPFLLRRLKNQVLDELPPKTEIILPVELSEGEMALYEALRQQAIKNINSENKQGAAHIQALAELTRLRLACCNPRLIKDAPQLESSKLSAFLLLIEELMQNRHRALVFSQFTSHLALIRESLDANGVCYLYLDGSTPIKRRGELVQSFQQGSTPVFLISLKAGGLGLNLTGADFVIHLDPWWNPAVEDQATDRTHRIGQTRPVTVYRLVASGTIEEKIIRLHHTKRDLAESILMGADSPSKVDVNEMLRLLNE